MKIFNLAQEHESEQFPIEQSPDFGNAYNIFLHGELGGFGQPVGDTVSLTTKIIRELLYWDNRNISNIIAKKSAYPIILHINSFGGEVFDALNIIDTMWGLETPVVTYCSGKAMSAGAMILMAGEAGHRYISPNAYSMLHEIRGGAPFGPISRMALENIQSRKLQNRLEKFVMKNSNIKKNEIQDIMNTDAHYDAKETLKFGLCDYITKSVPKVVEGMDNVYFTDLKKGAILFGKNRKGKARTNKKSKAKKTKAKRKKKVDKKDAWKNGV